ncbi:bifunctional 2-polyprenyl-6-hydroxyphenol methylase/3-demethylubiquinol 3-O-methyltransferase UbiG [Microbacterium sp. SORGH_AS_0888]|uniref:class I SAM-dependent methyltransferase n=1 Tax=Microbacterium sp. SORGH_AS_0888 TaxID=3041791 RepID=UPI0027D81209|nr:class I SAM-dependent methyltransferase [Microbacterium sp. SORGH_AS_0888]
MRWKNGRWRLATPDRVVLEDVIIPGVLAAGEVDHVLDIGVAWYTRNYPRLFRGIDYWSVDVDPAEAEHRRAHHHTLSATKLTDVFAHDTFDLVLCNGVIGWGLNRPEQVALGLDACAAVLRPGGWLVVGWNDVPGHRVEGLEEMLAARFDHAELPVLGADHYLTDTHYRHRYDFFRARS